MPDPAGSPGAPFFRAPDDSHRYVLDVVRRADRERFLAALFAPQPERSGLLHADPHPGNFRVAPDGRLIVLDYGSTAELPDGLPPTMGRLLTDYLARNKVTITELIHRADLLEKLEATGTMYQFAIQKVAVAQAANTTTGVQQIVKSLNELTTKALHRVYRDQRVSFDPRRKFGSYFAADVMTGY
mgnify:CR=1 FL=1